MVRDCAPLYSLPNEPFAMLTPLPFKEIRGLVRQVSHIQGLSTKTKMIL